MFVGKRPFHVFSHDARCWQWILVSPDHIELLTISAFYLDAMSADAIETDAGQRVVAVFVVPLLEPICAIHITLTPRHQKYLKVRIIMIIMNNI